MKRTIYRKIPKIIRQISKSYNKINYNLVLNILNGSQSTNPCSLGRIMNLFRFHSVQINENFID